MLSLIYEPAPSSEDISFLLKGINQEAFQKKNQSPIELFAYFIRDDLGILKGGLTGTLYYGCLYIDQLYLIPELRKQGYGTKLIQAVENLAISEGCTFSTVNTMDWEAKGFYEKLGYTVEFERQGYKNNSSLYFLRKNF
jgi:GNAT superfamily N-acetyltransferase